MSRKNLILGGILVFLIVVAYFFQGPFKKIKNDWGKPDNFLEKIDFDGIDKIEISNNKTETALEKNGERWKIGGTKDFFVKTSVSENLKNNFKEAIKSDFEIASKNKDKKKEFLTDDENGIKIKIYQNNEVLADFLVGKMASDYKSSYLSKLNIDETYKVNTDLYSVFNQSNWRDNTIFFSNKEKINKVRFQYPNREFTVEKNEEVWKGTIPYDFEVNEEKIEKVLDLMSDLTSVEIPEQKFDGTGLEKNLIIVQATGDSVNNLIMVGEKNEENMYYVKKGDSDNIYLITEDQRDELDKKISNLK